MKTIKCNVCGCDFDCWDRQSGYGIHHDIGYGSQYDGETINLNICCGCFDILLGIIVPICKINPMDENEKW